MGLVRQLRRGSVWAISRSNKWGLALFGSRVVLDSLEAQVTPYDNSLPGPSRPTRAYPHTVQEIAGRTRLSEWYVRICLRRLLQRKLGEQDGSGRWHVVLFGEGRTGRTSFT